jgi:hypothetical protein
MMFWYVIKYLWADCVLLANPQDFTSLSGPPTITRL